MMECKYGAKANSVNYRCKRKGWKRLYINLLFKNGKEYFKSATFDPYMQLFLSNRSQRNACFHCPFTTVYRQGDISLGDFWGIGREYPKLDDDKGISMILINSEKGIDMYNKIKHQMITFNSNLNQAIAGNKVLIENIPGEEKRNEFYSDYINGGLQSSFSKHTQYYPQWKQYYLNFMRWGLDIIRRILQKSY